MTEIKEPLRTVFKKFCHVECYAPQILRNAINSGYGFPYDVDLFRKQLRDVIDNKSITTAQYEQLTDEDFDSQDDLLAWLEELWLEVQ